METAFAVLILLSVVFALVSGNMDALNSALLSGAERSVELLIAMAGGYMFWCGLIEMMDSAGITGALAKLARPILARLTPNASDEALGAMTVNISANMLGLGNAATPAGLRAMRLLADKGTGTASRDMIMFVVLNISSVQLLPTGAMNVLAKMGASDPESVILPSLIATAVSTVVGIISVVLLCGRKV